MLNVLLALAGVVQTWTMTTPLQGSARMVILADVDRFRFTPEIASQNYESAKRHLGEVINAMPPDWRRWAWEFRQCNVRDAWSELYEAKAGTDLRKRLESLDRLRLNIGNEAYYAGWMPAAVPDYGAFPPVK